jgi:bla regulator protein BlaR1
MTLSDLSPLANHLWQSTIFAIAAWLLTLALRKNRASVRYWIWFAASVKFLIPFSLLVGIGNKFAWHSSPAITQPQFANAISQISQPFAIFTETSTAIPPTHASSVLPTLLLAAWLCGAMVVLIFWLRSVQQIRAIRRAAAPLPLNLPILVMSSPARMEPGVFGIFKPVLILPEGIANRLSPAQINAVIAHELCHVQRKDNLTAAIHMLVETIFWFHPFVWRIQTQLVAERERSCDETVVATANDPQVYAEAILNVCKLYIESPLRCVSGVTGANLKKRIRAIVSQRVAGDLNLSRKFMLTVAAAAAFAIPLFVGMVGASSIRAQSQVQNPVEVAPLHKFEVASIKPDKTNDPGHVAIAARPDGLTMTNFSLVMLIKMAYGVRDDQISGGPNWFSSETYDIEAKPDSSVAEELQKLNPVQRTAEQMQMLRALLADRFQLTIHRENKELPVYVLVAAKNGPKIREAKPGDTYPNGIMGAEGRQGPGAGGFQSQPGSLIAQAVPISYLVKALSGQLDRTVLDKTGLTGNYDFTLKWTPERQPAAYSQQAADSGAAYEPPVTSIFAAIEAQLGLKLESQKGPVEVIVIDHVERPSGN